MLKSSNKNFQLKSPSNIELKVKNNLRDIVNYNTFHWSQRYQRRLKVAKGAAAWIFGAPPRVRKPQVGNPYSSPYFRASAVISAIVVHFCNCNIFLDNTSNFIPHLPTTIYGISPHVYTVHAEHLRCWNQCHRCSPKVTAASNINPSTCIHFIWGLRAYRTVNSPPQF